jgi:UDP-N-acetyl-D-glucosamine dehydrogenase
LEGVDAETAFGRGIDCAVITTNHRCFDYQVIADRSPLVVDTRNALRGILGGHIFRL